MLNQSHQPQFIDLFAGCGGLSLGLMQAGWEGLFAVEKSSMAFETLKANLIGKDDRFSYSWPSWLPAESIDIQLVLSKYQERLLEIKGVDLLAGGPPCQGFSLAGRRDVNDVRNKLVEDYLKFIDLIQPKIILLENVMTFATPFSKTERGDKGLPVIEDQFNADEFLQQRLRELKYKPFVKRPVWAKDYGVPQLRPRYILIGIREDLLTNITPGEIDPFKLLQDFRQEFFTSKTLPTTEVTLKQAISDLKMSHGTVNCIEAGMGKRFKQGKYGPYEGPYQAMLRKTRSGREIAVGSVPDSHRFANHKKDTITRFQKIISDVEYTPGKQLTKEQVEAFGLQKHRVALLSDAEVCHTLTSLPDDLVHYNEPRILTVREYARIQSFPDWFEFKSSYTSGGKRRRNDVPRYTQVANAVPPLLAEALGKVLLGVSKMLIDNQSIPVLMSADRISE